MTRRRWVAVTVVSLALIGAAVGGVALLAAHRAIATDSSGSYFYGYYGPKTLLTASSVKVADGEYEFGYSLDVRFESPNPTVSVKCGLVDPKQPIEHAQLISFRSASGDGRIHHLTFSTRYNMPTTTVELRCSPSKLGRIGITVTNLHWIVQSEG